MFDDNRRVPALAIYRNRDTVTPALLRCNKLFRQNLEQYIALLRPPMMLCNALRLFVCLSVCLLATLPKND